MEKFLENLKISFMSWLQAGSNWSFFSKAKADLSIYLLELGNFIGRVYSSALGIYLQFAWIIIMKLEYFI